MLYVRVRVWSFEHDTRVTAGCGGFVVDVEMSGDVTICLTNFAPVTSLCEFDVERK